MHILIIKFTNIIINKTINFFIVEINIKNFNKNNKFE